MKNNIQVRGLIQEDLAHFKDFALVVHAASCNFKCCYELCLSPTICANYCIDTKPYPVTYAEIINLYESNPLHRALVFAGLEPLDQIEEVFGLIDEFSKTHNDPIIVYTGYLESEPKPKRFIKWAKSSGIKNIIIKVGRFIPNRNKCYDVLLGVALCSPNQYAIKLT